MFVHSERTVGVSAAAAESRSTRETEPSTSASCPTDFQFSYLLHASGQLRESCSSRLPFTDCN